MQTHEPAPYPDPVLMVMRLVFVFALLALAVLVGWYFLMPGRPAVHDPRAEPLPVTPRGDLAADEQAIIDLFERVSPSVVFITTVSFRPDSYRLNVFELPRGSGSGFVWSKDGHVVTNFHVIQGADEARVTLADQTSWRARLVGADPSKDVAVLKIDAPTEHLPPIPIGTSRNLRVGQRVFAIGNPFGLDRSMSMGIISGLNREITSMNNRTIQGVIQTDAAINPGNSGGPLLDSAGRLIGVNAAIATRSGTFSGVGFAVPVDVVNRTVPDLIRNGQVTRVGLGIHVHEVSPGRLMVLHVRPGSAADRAGLKGPHTTEQGARANGDILLTVDNEKVDDYDALLTILEKHKEGDVVTVRVQRGDRELAIPVKLQAME